MKIYSLGLSQIESFYENYTNNAKIIRVVNKKQGGQASVVIPFDRYLKEMQTHTETHIWFVIQLFQKASLNEF